jgi:hypothetical protein
MTQLMMQPTSKYLCPKYLRPKYLRPKYLLRPPTLTRRSRQFRLPRSLHQLRRSLRSQRLRLLHLHLLLRQQHLPSLHRNLHRNLRQHLPRHLLR